MTAMDVSAGGRRKMVGVVLVLVAAAALLEKYTDLNFGAFIVLAIGILFLVRALWTSDSRMLVPGCILTGLGAGLLLPSLTGSSPAGRQALFFFCFAAGFAAITLLAQVVSKKRMLWPLIPAGFLFLTGLGKVGGPDVAELANFMGSYWPVLLLIVGLWFLFSKPGK